jgi:hypothetical protein
MGNEQTAPTTELEHDWQYDYEHLLLKYQQLQSDHKALSYAYIALKDENIDLNHKLMRLQHLNNLFKPPFRFMTPSPLVKSSFIDPI